MKSTSVAINSDLFGPNSGHRVKIPGALSAPPPVGTALSVEGRGPCTLLAVLMPGSPLECNFHGWDSLIFTFAKKVSPRLETKYAQSPRRVVEWSHLLCFPADMVCLRRAGLGYC